MHQAQPVLEGDRSEPIEIDLGEPTPPSTRLETRAQSHPETGLAPAPTPSRADTGTAESEAEAPLAAVEGNASGEASPGEVMPPSAPIDLGLGPEGWQRWVSREPAPGAPAPRSGRYRVFHAPPVSSTGGLQEGLEERDRKLGLGPSGRVVTAFHRAAHDKVAPELGNASFQVTVLSSGKVEVTLDQASGADDKWRAVALRAAQELGRAPPRIPPPRQGVRMLVEVTAEELFPNGLPATERHGLRLEPVPLRLRSTDEAKAEIEDRNPTAGTQAAGPPLNLEVPGVYLSARGKVCGYRVGVTPLGPLLQGGCDLSNLGAKPERRVRARVREEALF